MSARLDDAGLVDAAIEGVRGIEPQPRPLSAVETMDRALDAMVVSLDPHSSYLNPEELRETQVSTKGKFGGLGIEVTMEDGLVKVVSPIENTPADRAGLKPGDLITHIDGEAIKGLTLLQAVKRMRGRPGTDIILTVSRGVRSAFDVTITRAIITVQSVRWRIEEDIGYIRVATFTVQGRRRGGRSRQGHPRGARSAAQGVGAGLARQPRGPSRSVGCPL